jgi:hypothetical protein
MIGSFESSRLTVRLEISAKPPDLRVENTGFGEGSQGFNGEVGWSMNVTENGLHELTGPALARFRRQSLFNREVIDFEDYREVDGVKLPFTIRLKIQGAGTFSSIFREIRHNVTIDESKFKVPTP